MNKYQELDLFDTRMFNLGFIDLILLLRYIKETHFRSIHNPSVELLYCKLYFPN